MKKFGIFGGTFNPPHKGHIKAVEQFKSALHLEDVFIIPAGIPPHKQVESNISAEYRLQMARLSFPHYKILDYEIKSDEISYTINTLKYLKSLYPKDRLHFLIGTDMFLSFLTWYCPEEILTLCTLCVVQRDDGKKQILKQKNLLEDKFNASIEIINSEPIDISSTQLREKIKKNEDVSCYIANNVLEYINEKKLYR